LSEDPLAVAFGAAVRFPCEGVQAGGVWPAPGLVAVAETSGVPDGATVSSLAGVALPDTVAEGVGSTDGCVNLSGGMSQWLESTCVGVGVNMESHQFAIVSSASGVAVAVAVGLGVGLAVGVGVSVSGSSGTRPPSLAAITAACVGVGLAVAYVVSGGKVSGVCGASVAVSVGAAPLPMTRATWPL
jgi:hypothetical protein